MGAGDEIVTIVDRENNVVGAMPRREMRTGRLPHRATYVLVFNSRGELYVQKRTRTKDVFPGYYDVVTGGVILAGESYEEGAVRELGEELGYEEGAVRELGEELGIHGVPLTPLFDFYYEDEHIRVWGKAFSCDYDGEVVLEKEEVESGAFLKVEEVLRLVESEPFTPDSIYVLRRYLGDGVEH